MEYYVGLLCTVCKYSAWRKPAHTSEASAQRGARNLTAQAQFYGATLCCPICKQPARYVASDRMRKGPAPVEAVESAVP